MPHAVAAVAPIVTMPQIAASAYQRQVFWEGRINYYADGSRDVATISNDRRASFTISAKANDAQLAAIVDFYNTLYAADISEFNFYDGFETSPQFATSPTGSDGLYVVRFDGNLSTSIGLPRHQAQFGLIEIS